MISIVAWIIGLVGKFSTIFLPSVYVVCVILGVQKENKGENMSTLPKNFSEDNVAEAIFGILQDKNGVSWTEKNNEYLNATAHEINFITDYLNINKKDATVRGLLNEIENSGVIVDVEEYLSGFGIEDFVYDDEVADTVTRQAVDAVVTWLKTLDPAEKV